MSEHTEAIKAKLPLPDYLQNHGVSFRKEGNRLVARCPLPGHVDEHPSFQIDPVKNRFTCHSHPAGKIEGDIFDFVMLRDGISFTEVKKRLAVEAGIELPAYRNGRVTSESAALELLKNRGLRDETIAHFGIKADMDKGAWSYPVSGGTRYKSFNSKVKQFKYWNDAGLPDQLYGLDHIPEGTTDLVLANGDPAMWICWQAAVPAFCATIHGEGSIAPGIIEALRQKGITSVTIVPDLDGAGRGGAAKRVHTLSNDFKVTIKELPSTLGEKADINDLYLSVGCKDDAFRDALENLPVGNPDDYLNDGQAPAPDTKEIPGPQVPAGTPREEEPLSWPEPEAITTSLKDVSHLPSELIPDAFQAWAVDVAHRMVCPLDFVAVAVIVMAGSLIGAGCGIRPKRRDDWMVIPNLWGGVVGRPGSLKTPALQEALTPLSRLESEAKATYDRGMRDFEAEREAFRAQRDAMKGEMLAAAKGKTPDGPRMDDVKQRFVSLAEPTCPTWRRYKTNDSTVEKMAELLRDNPRGVLLFRDELVGLLTSWDREGRESDRAFFLEAWNGYGSHTSDRIGRGTIHVNNLCISILGGIQPGKLLSYLQQASSELENDGLLQRMQLLVYPDEQLGWILVDQYPDAAAKQRAFRVAKAMADMEFTKHGAIQGTGDNIPYFHFDEQGQELFYDWLRELEEKLRTDAPPVLLEHLSKYRSLMPSLALIDHLVAMADGAADGPVSLESAERAAAWCEYLESHARRIYGLSGDVAQRAGAELAKKLRTGRLPHTFTLRDIYRNEWFLLATKGAAEAACSQLEDAGWLQTERKDTAGRPTTVYHVNPKIPTNAGDNDPTKPTEAPFVSSVGSPSRDF